MSEVVGEEGQAYMNGRMAGGGGAGGAPANAWGVRQTGQEEEARPGDGLVGPDKDKRPHLSAPRPELPKDGAARCVAAACWCCEALALVGAPIVALLFGEDTPCGPSPPPTHLLFPNLFFLSFFLLWHVQVCSVMRGGVRHGEHALPF